MTTELRPFLTEIANAIRNKKGTTAKINAQNFASEIESIEGGGGGAALIISDGQARPVPYDSTTFIENIYVNTSLSKEEVVTLLQNNFNLYPSATSIGFAVIAYGENGALVFVVQDGMCLIFDLANEIYCFVYDTTGQGQDITELGFSGWNTDFNGVIVYNSTNALAVAQNWGSQQGNDALKSLFSITPLEKEIIELSGDYKAKTINKTINVVENGTTTLSYSSDFDINKEILNNVNIVLNISGMQNRAQILINARDGDLYNLFLDAPNLTYDDLVAFFDGTDTSGVTAMAHCFSACPNLTSIPLFDTSNVKTFEYAFHACAKLTSIPLFDTSSTTNMRHMFTNLPSLTTIPQFDTSNVTNMEGMFWYCTGLTTIPQFDTSNVTNMGDMFYNCPKLKSILMTGIKTHLDISVSTQFGASDLVVILNNLATVTSTKVLRMGSTNLSKLTDEEKAIATNKGWTLA